MTIIHFTFSYLISKITLTYRIDIAQKYRLYTAVALEQIQTATGLQYAIDCTLVYRFVNDI